MDFNMKKNFKHGLLLSTLSLSLASLLACTDYADEYAGDWDSVFGDDAKVEDETPQYSMDCENVLWYAYDGENFMEQTTLGTSWENFADANSDILFTGLDKNNIRFNANFLENDLTPYLRYKGGISGELLVPEGPQDFFAGVRFGFGETDVLEIRGGDKANIEGFCLAYKSAYDDIELSLMDVDDNGEILTEFRTGPLGASSEVQTIKVPLSSFFLIGDSPLDALNSFGVVFSSKNRNSEGFVIVGVGTYGGTKPELPEPGSSSSSMFYWSAIDETASSDIDWYNYTDSSDASNGGESYFLWPANVKDGNMDGVVRACKGLCGAVHMRLGGNSDPYAGVGFTVSQDQREKIRSSIGMCVTYVSEAPVKMRLLPENPGEFDYDVPVKTLEKAMQVMTMNISWSSFSEASAGSGKQVAAALNSVDFQFEGMETPDAFFDILAVGEYDACSQFPLVVTSATIEELKTKINMDKYEYSSYATDIPQEDVLWYGANSVKNKMPNLSSDVNFSFINDGESVKWSADGDGNSLTLDAFFENCKGGVCGSVKNMEDNDFPGFGWNLEDDVDATAFGGVCLTYMASNDKMNLTIQRGNGGSFYRAYLPKHEKMSTECLGWDSFKLVIVDGEKVKIKNLLSAVKTLKVELYETDDLEFNVVAIGKYSKNISASEEFLNRKENKTSAWDYANPSVKYDTIVDSRDGQQYLTVKIGEFTWFAENLNYAADGSECTDVFTDDSTFRDCDIYGREYTWEMVQNVCPEEWHVSSMKEYQILSEQVESRGSGISGLRANTKLWIDDNGNYAPGSNELGFSALPTWFDKGVFLWTGDGFSDLYGYAVEVRTSKINSRNDEGVAKKSLAWPVRCVQDYVMAEQNVVSRDVDGKCYSLKIGTYASYRDTISSDLLTECPDSLLYKSCNAFGYSGDADAADIKQTAYWVLENNKELSLSKVKAITWTGATDASSFDGMDESYANWDLLEYGTTYTPEVKIEYNDGYVQNLTCQTLKTKINPCAAGENCSFYDEVLNTLYDGRNGLTYKTTKIGNQVWMAENLNYDDETVNGRCYGDKADNCKTYGRLYSWSDAQNVCPDGWHLPDSTESKTLLSSAENITGKGSGYALMSSGDDWITTVNKVAGTKDGDVVHGGDLLGFNVLPAGDWNGYNYDLITTTAYFWSSDHGVTTSGTENVSMGTFFWFNSNALYLNGEKTKGGIRKDQYISYGFSVRCLKD